MNCAETTGFEKLAVQEKNIVHMPLGLLGFEQVKKYVLLADSATEPFLWLELLENSNTAFLVIPPALVVPDYQPDISEEDARFLNLQQPDDALVLNIVNLRPDGNATINLKGPLVINRLTFIGKQVIPVNAAEYSVSHPIQVG